MNRLSIFLGIALLFVMGIVFNNPATATASDYSNWPACKNQPANLWIHGNIFPSMASTVSYKTPWNIHYDVWKLEDGSRYTQGDVQANNNGDYFFPVPNPNTNCGTHGGYHVVITCPEDWNNFSSRVSLIIRQGDNFPTGQITAPNIHMNQKLIRR